MTYQKIPVLFCFFNRKETALTSFERIKKFQPLYLFLASDGPRLGRVGEKELVEDIRRTIVGQIDWDCNVETLFREENLGCGMGMYTAIDWFFENVGYGVVLEDDCVVEESFFRFMGEMLEMYKNDNRIGMVAGTNPVNLRNYDKSYLFSKYKSCWGWGSWKRAWKNMDINMTWREEGIEDIVGNCGFQGRDIDSWKRKIVAIDKQYVSAWDHQWYFSLSAQNQLCIYPVKNLVSNIGNDENATHTGLGSITIPSFPLDFPLVHPRYVVPNIEFDKAFYKQGKTLYNALKRHIPYEWRQSLKKIIFKIRKKCQK